MIYELSVCKHTNLAFRLPWKFTTIRASEMKNKLPSFCFTYRQSKNVLLVALDYSGGGSGGGGGGECVSSSTANTDILRHGLCFVSKT